jgi:hypothetical protein
MTDPDRARHLAEDGLGLVEVVDVEQRADHNSGRAADQDADRTAENPDDQADDATGGRSMPAVPPPLEPGDLTVLTAWTEAVAEALCHDPEKLEPSLFGEARGRSLESRAEAAGALAAAQRGARLVAEGGPSSGARR